MATTAAPVATSASAPRVLAPLARRIGVEHVAPAFRRDPDLIARLLPRMRLLDAYFSVEVRNADRLPASGPVLVVGNHSCSFYMPDAWLISQAVAERRGVDAPAYGLIYDLLLAMPAYGSFLRRIGALPADEREAATALDEGAAVVVFPGGDHDACRPWRDRDRVDFAGRKGFVRLALRTGVPVVPVVAHGAHHGMVVLDSGERFARLLGLGGLRVKAFPWMLAPPFGVSPILALPPLPAQITVQFLPPMPWDALTPETADDPATVSTCYDAIVTLMQATMQRLATERPHPVADGVRMLSSRLVRTALHRATAPSSTGVVPG